MSEYSLAVDIGASSGRLILGHIENGKMFTEEIHRFKNGIENMGGHFCWDIEHLFDEIIVGMKNAATRAKFREQSESTPGRSTLCSSTAKEIPSDKPFPTATAEQTAWTRCFRNMFPNRSFMPAREFKSSFSTPFISLHI